MTEQELFKLKYENLSELYEDEIDIPEGMEWKEACVVLLRKNSLSYGNIQVLLGNPGKKWIRQTLLRWSPELIDIKTT